jgi:apolipoprotein D and lipocalin family protein
MRTAARLGLMTLTALPLLTAPPLSSAGAPSGIAAPLRVVESVDLKQYAGRWYEAARLPNKFQHKCTGDVLARYTLRADGKIDVVNQCRTADGKMNEAHGIGRRAGDGKNNARLEVRFAPSVFSFLPMTWGDYWIIGLGPDYNWAVVGTPSREYLWILSRTPGISGTSYDRAVEIARGNGFDVNRLVKTPQNAR